MASGLARGAKERGKRIAFGDGRRIIWHRNAEQIFRGNPNVAPPGQENAKDIEWIANYGGHRPYVRAAGDRWVWTPGHNNKPGEIFLDEKEQKFGRKKGSGFIVIEPNVPLFKRLYGPNKQWPKDRFAAVAHALMAAGHEVVQFDYDPPYGPAQLIPGVSVIKPFSFRYALAVLQRAALYLGSEGGLHHGAAAVGIPAVVIFGGFISPAITGYDAHMNIFTGGEPCGSLRPCEHCRRALDAITIEQVYDAAMGILSAAGK